MVILLTVFSTVPAVRICDTFSEAVLRRRSTTNKLHGEKLGRMEVEDKMTFVLDVERRCIWGGREKMLCMDSRGSLSSIFLKKV